MRVELTVNGQSRSADVETRRMLSELLRQDLGLTGTHLGCEHGVCGACTVLIDGEPARSCLTLAVQASGTAITTIEGLGSASEMHPIQQGFYEAMSFQCGFCTPGFVMTTLAYLTERAESGAGIPDDGSIRVALGGNLCRCTGYQSIVDGVRRAAELFSAQEP
jgi:carbon-monoxide dehydrogenase small subunit